MAKENVQLDNDALAALGMGSAEPTTERVTEPPAARQRDLKKVDGGKTATKAPAQPKQSANDVQRPNLDVHEGDPKKAKTYSLRESVIDSVADCVVGLQKMGEDENLSNFVEEALLAAVKKAQKKHNGNEPFPKRQSGPRRGRPIA